MKTIYNCYSHRLCQYLMENGLEPITTSVRTDNGLFYHVFRMTQELDELLTKWSQDCKREVN